MMIEPTETESKETLDAFIDAMVEIAGQAQTQPEGLKSAPKMAVVCRPNETLAAKSLNIASL
jgi:glycine dehydrogenase subunit 2